MNDFTDSLIYKYIDFTAISLTERIIIIITVSIRNIKKNVL